MAKDDSIHSRLTQSNFSYTSPANVAVAPPLRVSIHADQPHLRAQLHEDALAAGLSVGVVGDLGQLLNDPDQPLDEVLLLDCPDPEAATLAALAQLDIRAARAGVQLVVSTSLAALDEVFGCLDQSVAQVLVDPSHSERVLALALVRLPAGRVRELSDQDRLTLLRLTEQVRHIAEQIDRLGARSGLYARAAGPDDSDDPAEKHGDDSAFRLESPRVAFMPAPAPGATGAQHLVRGPRAALPHPQVVRRIIRQRQLRARFFDGDLFADPAWDILLDLSAAQAEKTRVSVTSLCIASGVPPTTALRWIGQMTDAGLLQRIEDQADRRRVFITLTDKASESLGRYFAEIDSQVALLI